MLSRFVADHVCSDSTHGVSGYEFELVTLMVIDDFEEGVPVAFCITSSVGTNVPIHFFQNVKPALSRSHEWWCSNVAMKLCS